MARERHEKPADRARGFSLAIDLPLAITMGDSAGIGPEIIAKAFRDSPADLAGCVVVGDVSSLRRAAALVEAGAVAQLERAADWQAVPPRCIPVLQKCEITSPVPYGQISGLAGKAAADCIVWATRATLRAEFSALVTAPIHKEALAAAGGAYSLYPGHTELLQAEAAAFLKKELSALPVRMMLANEELKTVLVSIHLSLRDAIEAVTFERVLQT